MASANTTRNTDAHGQDLYVTRPAEVLSMLKSIPGMTNQLISGDTVLEPACGTGNISKVLEDVGAQVYSSDRYDWGFGQTGVNFLNGFNFKADSMDWVITNPPYKKAAEFVQQALKVSTKGVCMLLRLAFLEGQDRVDWLKTTPLKEVHVYAYRVSCPELDDNLEEKSVENAVAYAWYYWEHGYEGDPVIKWITK